MTIRVYINVSLVWELIRMPGRNHTPFLQPINKIGRIKPIKVRLTLPAAVWQHLGNYHDQATEILEVANDPRRYLEPQIKCARSIRY